MLCEHATIQVLDLQLCLQALLVHNQAALGYTTQWQVWQD